MTVCEGCNEEREAVCQDFYCRACHISISRDDYCTTRTDAARICVELGHPVEDARRMFPSAKI